MAGTDLPCGPGLGFDDGLRKFLSAFRLPGEAQKIERIMNIFAAQVPLSLSSPASPPLSSLPPPILPSLPSFLLQDPPSSLLPGITTLISGFRIIPSASKPAHGGCGRLAGAVNRLASSDSCLRRGVRSTTSTTPTAFAPQTPPSSSPTRSPSSLLRAHALQHAC
eukprot:1754163-Rhodomonas_salina.1